LTTRLTNQLYWLLDQPKHKASLGAWEDHVGDFDEVLGYTALADFILRNPQTREYLVFYPQKSGNNVKNYGPFESLADFRQEVLDDRSFVDSCLRSNHVSVLASQIGSLGDSEVYYPVPFQCLGGSGALSTFDKGNVWVFVNLLGQSSL